MSFWVKSNYGKYRISEIIAFLMFLATALSGLAVMHTDSTLGGGTSKKNIS